MKQLKRIACLFLLGAFLLSTALVPAMAAPAQGNAGSYIWSKVSNDPNGKRQVKHIEQFEGEKQDVFKPGDTVRVSILMEEPSTLDKYGYRSASKIASNKAAMNYRSALRSKQDAVVARIEREALSGQKLNVVWHLTLAANLISANVKVSEIDSIANVNGVKGVYIENEYVLDDAQKVEGPEQSIGTSMTQTTYAWASGYTGAGSLIAIVDTGLDTTHELFDPEAFMYAIEEDIENGADVDLLTEEKLAEILPDLNLSDSGAYTAADLYLNEKVPLAFNIAEKNLYINHQDDKQSEHGTHVASIAAGNRYVKDADGSFVPSLDKVLTQGQAPDAQVIVFKYFSNRSGTDADYFAAMEDCILLGVDSLNLSLGSKYVSGLAVNRVYTQMFNKLKDSDLIWANSAGNSGIWTDQLTTLQEYGGYLYSEDVNFHTSGSPATYPTSFSVASVDNDGVTGAYLEYLGEKIFYAETSGYTNEPIKTIAGEYEFVYLDSVGTDEEFAAIADAVEGKIAICNRGTTSFYQKANAAVENGAIAVIIVNNDTGMINMNLTGYKYPAPAVSISLADGLFIKATADPVKDGDTVLYYKGSLTVSEQIGSSSYDSPFYTLSSFSSWGTTGDLQLKPNIAAPGGSIYAANGYHLTESGTYEGGSDQYELMSGTSMASPQIAGIAAVLGQYIRENGLKEKTGLSERQLIQSLLMSTATPMFEMNAYGYDYYSLLGQGAGFVDVAAAVSAKSVITMGDGAMLYPADGMVKAELGAIDTNEFSFKFNVINIADEDLLFDLYADFFTQDVFWYYLYDADGEVIDVTSYLDAMTALLDSTVSWKVNGVDFNPEGNLIYDFNGDGAVAYNDILVLLEYSVGNIDVFDNKAYADLNGDSKIDSYDAYLALDAINQASLLVKAGETAEIEISVVLNDIDDYYDNGAYIEGFVYVAEADTEDGALGVEHSIPVFGYYGDWSEPSMLDHGSLIDYYSYQEELTPYMAAVYGNVAYTIKAFYAKYKGESDKFAITGNPVQFDFDENEDYAYWPQRDAQNANTEISSVMYTLIRNAGAAKVTVTNQNGDELFSEDLGPQYSAHYPDGGPWQRTYTETPIGFTPGDAAAEGDVLTVSITFAPEYYIDEDGNVDWDALSDNASYTYTYMIDNTAPSIDAVDVHYDTQKGGFDRLDITATDNQYIAGVFVSTDTGEDYASFYSDPDGTAAAGGTYDYSVDFTELVDDGTLESLADLSKHLLVEVYDYAGNYSTYRINLNPSELNEDPEVLISDDFISIHKSNSYRLYADVTPWGVDNRVIWMSSDEDVAIVDEDGIVTAVAPGDAIITATSVLDANAYAECAVEVFVIDRTVIGALQDEQGYPLAFEWNLSEDPSWSKTVDLEDSISAMVYDWLNDALYQQTGDGMMLELDPETYEVIDVSAGTTGFGAPMEDLDMAYVYNMFNGTRTAYGVYGGYLLYADDIMENTFTYGWNLGSYIRQYTGGSMFLTCAWAGYDEDYNDIFAVLDDAGGIWFFYSDGSGSLNLGLDVTDTVFSAVASEDSHYNSMLMGEDGEYYLMHFNGMTSELYMLPYNETDEYFESIRIGDVGINVWPAALISVNINPDSGSGQQESGDAFGQIPSAYKASPKSRLFATGLEAADLHLPAEKADAVKSEIPAPAAIRRSKENHPVDLQSVQASGSSKVIFYIEADEDMTNGIVEFKYDPDVLAVDLIEVNADYWALNDEQAGLARIAFVNAEAISAGDQLVKIILVPSEQLAADTDTEVVVRYLQINDQYPGTEDSYDFQAMLPHYHTYADGPIWNWSDDYTLAIATFICDECYESTILFADIETEETPATYETEGTIVYTATVTLDGVDYTDIREETIPQLEYDFGEITFVWADDNKSATAYVLRGDGEEISVDVTMSSETTPATHTEPGATVYTASASFNGITATETRTVEIPAIGHTYGEPVWKWSDDKTMATATFSCDCGDTVLLEAVVTSITTAATYEAAGKIEYTATVIFGETTYTDTCEEPIPQLEYTYSEITFVWADDNKSATAYVTRNDGEEIPVDVTMTSETTPATHTEPGKTVYTASATFNEVTARESRTVVIPAIGHTYGEPVWTWSNDKSMATATFSCACGDTQILKATVTSQTTPATYTSTGKKVFTATVTLGEQTYTDKAEVTIPMLDYSYDSITIEWTGDSTATAYVLRSDGAKIDVDVTVTSETNAATHTKPGSITYTATAIYNGVTATDTRTSEIPAAGHTFGEPAWLWSEDCSLAAATFSCDCGEDGASVTILATVTETVENDLRTITAKVTFNGADYSDVKTKEVEEPKETTVIIVIDSVNGTQPGDISIYFYGEGSETIGDRTSSIEVIDYMLGDISGNSEIDAIDYLMAKRNVLGTLDFTDDQFKCGDVNRNKEIEILDYTMIKRHVLGTFTIEQPEPDVIPGPDFADNILISVDENGLVKSVNAEAGADKSAIEIPEFGYILSVPIDKFAEEQLQYLKEKTGLQLSSINAADYQDAGLDVEIDDSATASYTYIAE